jgi:hypothetical protein
LWRFQTSTQVVGLWVNELVWVANDAGEVFALDADGAVQRTLKLPHKSYCVFADEAWTYAGCVNGAVYDLTGRVPREMYRVTNSSAIGWIEGYRGNLCVSDHGGGITVIDVEGNVRWRRQDRRATEGWVARADATGVLHGSTVGLRKYDWDGRRTWALTDLGDVRFASYEGEEIVATAGWCRKNKTALAIISKEGRTRCAVPLSAGAGFRPNGAESCAGGRDKDGALRFYVGCGRYLFGFDGDGNPLWHAPTNMRSPCNMQLVGERLFMTMETGIVCCVDVSAAAIELALRGEVPAPRTEKAARLKRVSTELERTADTSKGVVVECINEGGKLRVRVVTAGYRKNWFCQFPRDVREEGARYVVDEVRKATSGKFYRVLGDIKRLVQ